MKPTELISILPVWLVSIYSRANPTFETRSICELDRVMHWHQLKISPQTQPATNFNWAKIYLCIAPQVCNGPVAHSLCRTTLGLGTAWLGAVAFCSREYIFSLTNAHLLQNQRSMTSGSRSKNCTPYFTVSIKYLDIYLDTRKCCHPEGVFPAILGSLSQMASQSSAWWTVLSL